MTIARRLLLPKPLGFPYLLISLALLCAGSVRADHLPDNKQASGKTDTVLCGFDAYEYLIDVLQRVGQHPASQAYELTPRLWKKIFASNPLRSPLQTIPAL